jgi:MATE family multidrug resistance protein
LPGIYFLGLLDSNRRFLNCLGHQTGPMVIQVITTSLHLLWCYILVDVMEWGAAGAGVATTLTHFLTLVGTYGYTSVRLEPEKREKAWFSPFRAETRAQCFDK